ncbi:hypothetical protein C1645_822987 [Glomus cerebriforme]|uniref:BTB domain-containing protein n=1 Tax=Glomus cerebriforme TaxID=658196 RepID=A0A397T6W5_9GLOM|nr:hypothetical protein C1645_822987 [Glomus cerebriforme]
MKEYGKIKKYEKETTNDMEDIATSYTNELHELPRINITDTSSLAFENFLSFIYPQKFVSITWDNIEEFCQIGDKYEFNSVLEAAEKFLNPHFHENPLLSLVLSDRYHFKLIFKESSKLVLNELQEYQIDKWYETFFEKYHLFNNNNNTISLPSKSMDIILKCLLEFWNDYINGIWPSECDYRFFNDYLAEQFVGHFGDFEPLNHEKSKKDPDHYMFIELKD